LLNAIKINKVFTTSAPMDANIQKDMKITNGL